MTYAKLFIQIISEVSGKPEQEIADLLSTFREAHPGGNWDQVIPANEAEKLLNDLREEAPGILAWLVKGAMDVARHESSTIH
ncbi:MAG: hypothetical protein JRJ50_12030 [Deltaproteobacteria bacterium]|nr:hypothetical protein [Deltaproteobacteria bacterium]MBW2342479.1 hypothetical protein [Deltaproteobacteria bacterium]